VRGRVICLGAALAIASTAIFIGLAGGAPARASTDLVGWTAQSDANVLDILVDNSSGLAGSHPLSEIDIPENFSSFQTGPLGYSLATVTWPGAVAGNFGSLAGELGLPSQLAPLASKLNDPLKAAAFYPAGPADSTYPSGAPSTGGLEMKSHSDANGSWAKAGLIDVSVPQLFDAQDVQGSTTATAGTAAESTASGSFHSLALLGGLIKIGATSSDASAKSDGSHPNGSATSHIGALTIAGQQVRVGNDGIVVGPTNSSASGLLSSAAVVNQVASALNLKITPLPQQVSNQAPSAQVMSGGLQIAFSLPSLPNPHLSCTSLPAQLAQLGVICTLPDILQGLNVTFTVGRVTAAAKAAPPFAISLGGSGPDLPAVGAADLSAPAGGGSVDLGGAPSAAIPGTATPTSPAGSLPSERVAVASISLSSPITLGLALTVLAIAVASGLYLRRLTGALGAPPPGQCPLEDAP
jgi:hypothetical protein